MTQPSEPTGFHFGQLEDQIASLTQGGSGGLGGLGGSGGDSAPDDPIAPIRGRSTELFRDTEGGNGDRMASRHGDFILCDKTGKTRTYYVARTNGLWVEDRDGEVVRRADEVVQEMYARAAQLRADEDDDDGDGAGRAGTLEQWARQSDGMGAMQAMAALAVDKYRRRVTAHEYFDRNNDIISTNSGVIALGDDGEITVRNRTLADRCTICAQASYRPDILDSPPPLVKQFLETFLPEEGRWQLIFKLLGYALRGGNRRRLFVILKGGTTSGKTQLVQALIETLGGYAGASAATVFRTSHEDKPRPDVIALYRKRIAFFAEASKSWRLEASRIKQFTGGDVDPQRGMHSDIIRQERPDCMPVIYTNEMPKIIGLDPATKRRVIIPTMDHTIPKDREDPTIKDRFMRDPNVRDWLLTALVWGYSESSRRTLVPGEGDQLKWRDGMWDVEREFALSTSDAINEMYHLSDFLAWLRGDDDDGDDDGGDSPAGSGGSATAQLTTVPPEQLDAWGMKSKYVTQSALYERYTFWVKSYGDRFDRLEQLSLVDFNRQLIDNHGFIRVSSGGPRWRGYILKDVTLAQLKSLLQQQSN